MDGHEVARWVRAAAAGDHAAWERIVDAYSPLVWSITRTYRLSGADAEDAFQVTWLRLLERIDSVQEPGKVGGWLATTCRRECQALLRRGRRTVPLPDEEALTQGDVSAADLPALIADRDATLWQAFSRLTEHCQAVLRVLVADPDDGPPRYSAAALALQMPVGSLGPTRRRCLEKLREFLREAGI